MAELRPNLVASESLPAHGPNADPATLEPVLWTWSCAEGGLRVNPDSEHLLDWPIAELERLLASSWRTVIAESSIAAVETAVAALQTGRAHQIDLRLQLRLRGGALRWVRIVATVLRGGPADVITQAQGFIEDDQKSRLRESDQRDQFAAIDRAQLVAEFDMNGRLLSANEKFLDAFGYSSEQLVGEHHCRLVAAADACTRSSREFWDRLGRGEYASGRYRRIGRSGREVWLQATYSPIFDDAGVPRKVIKFATDITEQHLRHADFEGQLGAIQRSQITLEFDLDGHIRTANPKALEVLGYRLDEVWGQHHRMFVDPDERDSHAYHAFWKALAAGQFASGLFRRRSKSGAECWLQATYSPILDPAGRPWKVVKYATDVTERVATERALRHNEIKLRSLFELSPVGITLFDCQTTELIEANDALHAVLGWAPDTLPRQRFEDLVTGAQAESRMRAILALPAGSRFGPEEWLLQRRDGSTAAVLLSGIHIEDEAGGRRIWSIVQSIEEHKAIERKLHEAASTDALTDLPNRPAFVARLEEAIAYCRANHGVALAVLFLDLDRFKFVNDTMGHAAGDQLLKHISRRLRSCVRSAGDRGPTPAGMAARFGGDEFAVLVPDLLAGDAIDRVASRVLEALTQPYEIEGRTVHTSASIGIVTSREGLESATELMRRADVAMYEAKQGGRARAIAFDEPMQTRLTRRLTLENDLRSAISDRQLSLAYQPIVDLETGQMTSVEALLRWTHPRLGPVSPAEFIPIAEEAQLIIPLGEWVLRRACTDFMDWRRTAAERAPQSISVNMSRSELARGDGYVSMLRDLLRELDMPSGALQLEVTEREVMRDPHLSLRMMQQLKDLDVRLAMDDFGTGASSLSCLRDYPFDSIKIDQSFLRRLESQRDVLMVLHATVTLIENLGMASVAEGVERASQVAVLQSIRCRYAQGYLFSRPVAGSALLGVDCLAWHRNAQAEESQVG